MLVFGGYGACVDKERPSLCQWKFSEFTAGNPEQMSSELWALDLAVGRWTRLRTLDLTEDTEITRRFGHVCVATGALARTMLCYGGHALDSTNVVLAKNGTSEELWEYEVGASVQGGTITDGTWRRLRWDPSVPRPGPREFAAAVPLPGGGGEKGMLLVGGRSTAKGQALGDMWRLDVLDRSSCGSSTAYRARWRQIMAYGSRPGSAFPSLANFALQWAGGEGGGVLLAFGGGTRRGEGADVAHAWGQPSLTLKGTMELTVSNQLWSWDAASSDVSATDADVCDFPAPGNYTRASVLGSLEVHVEGVPEAMWVPPLTTILAQSVVVQDLASGNIITDFGLPALDVYRSAYWDQARNKGVITVSGIPLWRTQQQLKVSLEIKYDTDLDVTGGFAVTGRSTETLCQADTVTSLAGSGGECGVVITELEAKGLESAPLSPPPPSPSPSPPPPSPSPSPPPPSPPPSSPSRAGGSSSVLPMIAGGICAALLLAALGGFCWWKKRKGHNIKVSGFH
jgi:hypothetical protein